MPSPTSLTAPQIEILRRLQRQAPLWQPDARIERLADETAFLQSCLLLQRDPLHGFVLTERGTAYLQALASREP